MGLVRTLRRLDVHNRRSVLRDDLAAVLRNPTISFVCNYERVASLLSYPVDLAADQVMWRDFADDPMLQAVKAEAHEYPGDIQYAAYAEVEIEHHNKNFGHSGFQALLQSATVLAWTTVECCARDVWLACASERPASMPTKVLDKKLSAREVMQLADPKLDLVQLLADQYNFRTIPSIKTAFDDMFGADLGHLVRARLNDDLMWRFERTRHLIVHDGARITDEFVEQTKSAQEVGSIISLTELDVARFVNSAIAFGKTVLAFADGWIKRS